LLDEISANDGKKRSFVFVSGSRHPPFLNRYLTTKIEAENYLLGLIKFNFRFEKY
jgi:hypothetical protein